MTEQIYLTASIAPATVTRQQAKGRSRRLTLDIKLALPSSIRLVVAARIGAGESLRSLAREYGVAHECIRRVALAARSVFQSTAS
jgi:hypothetical protein